MSFYNDKRVNPSRKYNNYKMYMHVTAEYQIYKSKLTELKREIVVNSTIFLVTNRSNEQKVSIEK